MPETCQHPLPRLGSCAEELGDADTSYGRRRGRSRATRLGHDLCPDLLGEHVPCRHRLDDGRLVPSPWLGVLAPSAVSIVLPSGKGALGPVFGHKCPRDPCHHDSWALPSGEVSTAWGGWLGIVAECTVVAWSSRSSILGVARIGALVSTAGGRMERRGEGWPWRVISRSGRRRADRCCRLTSERCTIGSSADSDLVVDDGSVSRAHALFEQLGGAWFVEDLGSRNGTYLNGQRITGRRVVRPGDEIRLGVVRVVLRGVVSSSGMATSLVDEPPVLTRRERDVLVALCQPLLAGDPFTEPASIREIATDTGRVGCRREAASGQPVREVRDSRR